LSLKNSRLSKTSDQTVHASWLGISITIPRCPEWII
jgi:hypothetical protein